MAENCEFCDEEFEEETRLHLHWIEEHEDELNSHQKDKAKKAKRDKKEQEKLKKQRRKRYLYQGVGAAVFLVLAALIVPQLIPSSEAAEISLEDEPMIGNEDATVTVVEFGDLQCPACSQFNANTFSRIESEYIESGDVRFYWKDFPLEQIHPWARTAAETMECVYREDEEAFWEVKGQVFANQNSLNLNNVEEEIISWASEEGVSKDAVRSCLQTGNPGQEVTQDIGEGRGNGVSGTPTIYVNGEQLGSFDYATVSQAIEEELAE